MKIDGYIPADPHIATEVGVELNYKVSVGVKTVVFNFRAKSSGKENKEFQKASAKLANKRSIRAATGFKQTAQEDLRETLEIWHDHAIIAWNTTATSGGEAIDSTKENFIDLLSMEDQLFLGVFTQLASDCADVANFQKEAEAAAVKNSQTTSPGK